MNSYLMRKAMEYAKAFNVPVISHAEDGALVGKGVMNEGPLSNELGLRGNPTAAEEIMVAREIALCRLTQCNVHIAHVSSALAIEHIRRAKDQGLPLTAEVTPHHLTLTDDCVRTYDSCFKMAPPLRTHADMDAVGKALADGTIDVIASDHAPHGAVDKCIEFTEAANGIIGLETSVASTYGLVRAGKLSLPRWVEAMTTAPAKVLNLPFGTLKKGAVADCVLFHPDKKWIFTEEHIESKSTNSPLIKKEFVGKIITTFVGGKKIYEA
jgi:dihydroorotase